MLKVWGRKNSANVQKAMWGIGELKLAHERIDIAGAFGKNKEPAYLALNPNGLVPTLEDGDLVLWDRNKTEVERRLAADVVQDRPAWEVPLVRNRYYTLASSLSRPEVPPNTIDLSDVQDDLFTYEFQREKSAKRMSGDEVNKRKG